MASEALLARLQAEFDSPPDAITAAVALLEDRAPPAFIARYRRHLTANMGEERLQAIADRLHFLLEGEGRKQQIRQLAEERGRLTPELQATLDTTADQDLLDDLYQSLRPRRRTAAMQMEEKGLMPLATALQHRQLGDLSLQDAAKEYVSEEKGLPAIENVLEGVLLILSEKIVHDPATRARFRDELRHGILRAKAVRPDGGGDSPYKEFFDFAEPVARIPANRMLALRRAEREGILQLQLTLADGRPREILRDLHGQGLAPDSPLAEFMDLVFDHAWNTGLQESCGRDVRRRMKEKADREAVRTWCRNLRSQMLAPPLGHKKVLSIRTSSKTVWACLLGEDGSVAQHKTLPIENDEQKKAALEWLCAIVRDEKPAAVAVPHGRRQAGSERLVDELRQALGETPLPMVLPVDEASSAKFATSQEGKKDLPGVEVGVRTAISLGRRLQDPLRELVRMDFRTLGLGQTLDDVHQGILQRELEGVARACVATVGVDLNTADRDLLALVPGLDDDTARQIVENRQKIGGYASRAALQAMPGLDERTFRNVAGFLTITGGSEPLDRTSIHPDDYELARVVAGKEGAPLEEVFGRNLRHLDFDALTTPDVPRLRAVSVAQALGRVGRDPRGELMATVNAGIRTFADLRADLELRGRVASLTEFGAFVDLGIGQDGLIHISQIPGHRLRDPDQMLRVGEVITVWVLGVDQEKGKISLTMYMPRHLQEGRQPTIGERMQQGGRQRRRERQPEQKPAFSRAARAPESRKGSRRSPPLTLEGKPEEHRGAGAGAGGDEAPREHRGRGPRDDRRGGPRQGGRGDQRVYTIESEREVAATKSHKGEFTSLAGLRALLGKSNKPADPGSASPAGGTPA